MNPRVLCTLRLELEQELEEEFLPLALAQTSRFRILIVGQNLVQAMVFSSFLR